MNCVTSSLSISKCFMGPGAGQKRPEKGEAQTPERFTGGRSDRGTGINSRALRVSNGGNVGPISTQPWERCNGILDMPISCY